MLPETCSELKFKLALERMNAADKTEYLISELETYADLLLVTADSLYRYDAGENRRVSALIASLQLTAKEVARRQEELSDTFCKITEQ